MPLSVPASSPTRTMRGSRRGISSMRLRLSARLEPLITSLRARWQPSSSTALPSVPVAISSASVSGRPFESRVLSVIARRATAACRNSWPKKGSFRTQRSTSAPPLRRAPQHHQRDDHRDEDRQDDQEVMLQEEARVHDDDGEPGQFRAEALEEVVELRNEEEEDGQGQDREEDQDELRVSGRRAQFQAEPFAALEVQREARRRSGRASRSSRRRARCSGRAGRTRADACASPR